MTIGSLIESNLAPVMGLLFLPAVCSIVCAFSVFFTDLVYSYDEKNTFIRGPLGYTTQICIIVYLIIFAVVVVRKQLIWSHLCQPEPLMRF